MEIRHQRNWEVWEPEHCGVTQPCESPALKSFLWIHQKMGRLSRASQNGCHHETKDNESQRRCGERGARIHGWQENTLAGELSQKHVLIFLKVLKIQLPYEPTILFLGIQPTDSISYTEVLGFPCLLLLSS